MPRFAIFEHLESRQLFSALTLVLDKAAVTSAVTQLDADMSTATMVIAADKAKVALDMKAGDSTLKSLRNQLKLDQLARAKTLLTDRTDLLEAVDNDQITLMRDRFNIKSDKRAGNTAQLAVDKVQLSKDQLALQTDRTTLNIALQDDTITTKATVTADKQAIVNEIRTHGNSTLAADKQTLINDQLKWTDTLAADRKAVATDRLIVSHDKHGGK